MSHLPQTSTKPITADDHNYDQALPITINQLTKRYGDLYALDAVDLNIESGEFLTLLGPSGSGKTTLLMAIAGFNRPDAGSIRFGDTEMILTPPHRRDVGMVFQSYALFPHMTVAQNIEFPLKLRGVNSDERKQRVDEALDTVQLSGLGERSIDQLSGGQRQRVALARAFVFRPRILLMDEPLSALDKKLRERMQIELKQLHRKLGVTTVYVTHDQREALTMSDRIAVINEGKLMQLGTPEAIYNQPVNAFVADFIGESTFLPLELASTGILEFQGNEIVEAPVLEDEYSEFDDENLTSVSGWSLVLRPERLYIAEENAFATPDTIVFEGIVRESVFQGESAYVLLTLQDGTEFSLRAGGGTGSRAQRLQSGETIKVAMQRRDVIVIPEKAH